MKKSKLTFIRITKILCITIIKTPIKMFMKRNEWIGHEFKNKNFRIIKEIGRGGYGQVYLAEDLRMRGNKKYIFRF